MVPKGFWAFSFARPVSWSSMGVLGTSRVSSNPCSFGTSSAGAGFSVTAGGVVCVASFGGFLGQPTTKIASERISRQNSSLALLLGIAFLQKFLKMGVRKIPGIPVNSPTNPDRVRRRQIIARDLDDGPRGWPPGLTATNQD